MHEDRKLNQLMEQAAAKMNIKVAYSELRYLIVGADSSIGCVGA